MKHYFRILIILFIFHSNYSFSQLQGQSKIDSLIKKLPNTKEDTNYVKLLSDLSFEFYLINPDMGIKYGEQSLKLSEKINWKRGISKSYTNLGVNYYWGNSDFPKALEYFLKALKINEGINNKIGIASNYGNIGNIFIDQSDYPKALEYFYKSLKINEEIGNKSRIAKDLGNIGNIFIKESNYEQALEYYFKSLKINEELGIKSGIATNLGNIGIVYNKQSDYTKALEYFHKAIKIEEELGNKSALARHVGNIGGLYLNQAQDSVFKGSENKLELILNKEIYLNQSIEYTNKSIDIFKEIGEQNILSGLFKNLSDAYLLKEDFKKAYSAYKEYKTLQDSVFSMNKTKEIAHLEEKRDNELKDKEIAILHSEKKAQQFQSYLLGGGVIVLIGAFGVAYLRFREKKKLSEALEIQKSIVEEKNEQIYASMTYASTIQNAILPWESTLKNTFSDILVFYKPKDIVSGDSYWFQDVDGVKYLAVIDCTGHGIPGAMLTVIASSVLDDAVLSKRLTNTGDILTFMNEKVTEVLNQKLSENSIRDGMEVALLAIHQDFIQFSGAGRPLFFRNGSFNVVKTDKRGIAGQTENDLFQFSSVEIKRAENMTLYLTSDGFADQMNESSKKFSNKRLTELLETMSYNNFNEQILILENEYKSHRGNREQIDDITVVGIKI